MNSTGVLNQPLDFSVWKVVDNLDPADLPEPIQELVRKHHITDIGKMRFTGYYKATSSGRELISLENAEPCTVQAMKAISKPRGVSALVVSVCYGMQQMDYEVAP